MNERATTGQRRGDDMSTRHLPWPRDAAEDRDRAAEAANEIVALLSDLLDGEALDHRIVGRCLDRAHTICRLLERQGAKTIPPTH